MVFMDYITRVIITLIGMVYPGYMSFKAMKRGDEAAKKEMLKYWLVLSVVSFVNLIADPIMYDRIPFWGLIKIAVVAFLALPTTRGYDRIFSTVLEPQLDKHEAVIDQSAANLYKAGEEQARNLGPTVNKMWQQGRDTVQKKLQKKAS